MTAVNSFRILQIRPPISQLWCLVLHSWAASMESLVLQGLQSIWRFFSLLEPPMVNRNLVVSVHICEVELPTFL